MLEEVGHKVHILDSLFLKNRLAITRTRSVKRVGASWKEIENEIRRISPDLVGITNPFTTQIDNAIKVADLVKNIDKDTTVVVGGIHASVRPFDFLKHGSIDIAVSGEGEYIRRDIAS